MHRYKAWNGPRPTSAAQQAVTTGTSIKTMLQLGVPSTRQIQILAWGFSIDDTPGADAVVELIDADTAATVTAHVAAGVQPLVPGMPASLLDLGPAATGYTSSSETAPTASRVHDVVSLSGTTSESPYTYVYQFMPDERPIIAVSRFVRVRATTPSSAVDMRCWVTWQE